MLLDKFLASLEIDFPVSTAEEWDFVGLQNVVTWKHDVQRILLCLDTTQEVVDYAITHRFDTIINHHPLAFGGLEIATSIPYKQQIFQQLTSHKIAVVALHTNFDLSQWSVNHELLKMLDCTSWESLNQPAFGFIGQLETSVTLEDLLMQTKRFYKTPVAQYHGDLKSLVSKVAVCSGAGGDLIYYLNQNDTDVIITGEMKWDQWIMAQQKQVNVIVLDHYMENRFGILMHSYLQTTLPALNVETYDIINPIRYF